MALDPVETALITVPPALEGLPRPVAELDRTVLSDELVALAGQLGRKVLVAHPFGDARRTFDP